MRDLTVSEVDAVGGGPAPIVIAIKCAKFCRGFFAGIIIAEVVLP